MSLGSLGLGSCPSSSQQTGQANSSKLQLPIKTQRPARSAKEPWSDLLPTPYPQSISLNSLSQKTFLLEPFVPASLTKLHDYWYLATKEVTIDVEGNDEQETTTATHESKQEIVSLMRAKRSWREKGCGGPSASSVRPDKGTTSDWSQPELMSGR